MKFKLAIVVFCIYSRMAGESSVAHYGEFLVFDKLSFWKHVRPDTKIFCLRLFGRYNQNFSVLRVKVQRGKHSIKSHFSFQRKL